MNYLKVGFVSTLWAALLHTNLIAQTCSCEKNLNALIASVERNYSGYDEKTVGNDKGRYIEFKNSLYREVTKASGYNCYLLLREYMEYFRDPHLKIRMANPDPQSTYNDTIRSMFIGMDRRRIKGDEAMRYFKDSKIDSIEGIWEAQDFPFRLAIMKDTQRPGEYLGLTLQGDSIRWFNGQIKLAASRKGKSWRITYYMNDHLPDTVITSLEGSYIDMRPYGTWKRIYPSGNQPTSEPPQTVGFRVVSEKTCMIRLKDGWISNREALTNVINDNLEVLNKTPNLIIDLRGNTGGHNMTYEPLFRFVYTRPIITDGLLLRASRDNIDLYKSDLSTEGLSSEEVQFINDIVSTMEKNLGTLAMISGKDSIIISDAGEFPKRVVLLVDKKTASASEMFILLAKQGGKVLVMGQPTRGELDYTDVVKPRTDLPCPYIQYTCPIGRGNHDVIPLIDNIGIKPDVVLSYDNDDWIQTAAKYIENMP